jgi:hypothetical protein
LPLFYIGLNICLGQIRLRSVNVLSLWQRLFSRMVRGAQSNT